MERILQRGLGHLSLLPQATDAGAVVRAAGEDSWRVGFCRVELVDFVFRSVPFPDLPCVFACNACAGKYR